MLPTGINKIWCSITHLILEIGSTSLKLHLNTVIENMFDWLILFYLICICICICICILFNFLLFLLTNKICLSTHTNSIKCYPQIVKYSYQQLIIPFHTLLNKLFGVIKLFNFFIRKPSREVLVWLLLFVSSENAEHTFDLFIS